MARRYIKFAFDHFRSIRRVEAPERFVTGTAEPAQRVVRHVVPGFDGLELERLDLPLGTDALPILTFDVDRSEELGVVILRCEAEALAVEARSEEHTSELQSLMRISYAVFCLKKKTNRTTYITKTTYNAIKHGSTI